MKILFGCREDKTDKDTLKIVTKHAKAFKAEVMIVTSLFGAEKTEKKEINKAVEYLEKTKKYFDDSGVVSETHLLVRGFSAGEDIVRFAKDKNVDMIIIRVKNRSKVGKFIFGSTAQVVILESTCPVLSVK